MFSMMIIIAIFLGSIMVAFILACGRNELEAVQHIAVNVKSSKTKRHLVFVRNG